MSKSLKNFITIKEILKQYTPNQIRLIFLLHKYDSLMSFSTGQLEEAKEKERRFS
jgi:cysteinyl-tRNA synthetase